MLTNLNEVLISAVQNGYGVGMFNCISLEMTEAVFAAAEKFRAPVIVGTAEILLPGASLETVADMILRRAKKSSVPVVLHYDHGLTFEKCIEAIKLGYTSIMYDCSTETYEENVREVTEIVKIAHSVGVSVEGELGHVGDNEGKGKLENPSDYYTDPQQALDFVERTGIDALAVAVGNAHGDYKFHPKLDFERISEIAEKVRIPLVLHGGSGLTNDDFQEAIRRGVAKINIFTDISKAQVNGIKKALELGIDNTFDMIPYEKKEIQKVAEEKIKVFSMK